MRFLKKQKNVNETVGMDLQNLYLENISQYVRFSRDIMMPLSYDKNNQEDDIKRYKDAVDYIVAYLRDNFNNEAINSGNVLEIDVAKMCEGSNNFLVYYLYEPKFSEIIYILGEDKYPHFHTNGTYVLSAEGIKNLPGLDFNLRKCKINTIFEGFDVFEARDLLKQMKVLPPNNNLEKEIHLHEQAFAIHKKLILSVVYNLLMSGKQEDVVRARLFADSFGVAFNFKPYEKDITENKKLCMGMKESTGC